MTQQEFNDVVAYLRDGDDIEARYEEIVARVMGAIYAVIKNRRGVPDGQEMSVSPDVIAEFLSTIDHRQMRLLKSIADDLKLVRVDLH
jgi:hypothetical protein